MRPLILLTCTEVTKDTADPSAQKPHSLRDADTSDYRRDGLLMSYVRSVVRAGGCPLLLPNVADSEAIAAAVEAAHGLLLTGGCDVAADLYAMSPHPTMSAPDRDRDATEKLAVAAAMRLGRPILGICRGIQMLNVVLGGTLIRDIPSHQAESAAERAAGPVIGHSNNATHDVRIETGSILHELWGVERGQVNSSHHQAAGRVAASLKATACAPDGIVEALESAEGYPLLAVQCHPERLAHKDERYAAVFRWLVQAALTKQIHR